MNLLQAFLPEDASANGYLVDNVLDYVHWLMLVLFVGWMIYFVYALFRFRASKNKQADHVGVKSHVSTYIEVAVVVFEVILLVGFSIPFWSNVVTAFPAAGESTVVRVIAEQFAWNVHYPGADGVFGKTRPDLVNVSTNPIGLDSSDPHAADDIVTLNQLNLPVDKPVTVYLSSKDVIHSFALQEMRVKQDVIPGMSIPTWFTPTKIGNYEIACAQLCGLGHYRMRGYLNIMTPKAYEEWLAEQAAAAQENGGEQDDFWS